MTLKVRALQLPYIKNRLLSPAAVEDGGGGGSTLSGIFLLWEYIEIYMFVF